MLVATFNETTAWAGKTITHEGDAFILEDHGPITAAGVMTCDRLGQLAWATDEMRAWVEPIASAPLEAPASPRANQEAPALADVQPAAQADSGEPGDTGSRVKKCPFCAEEILAEAIKCRFCQSDLTTPSAQAQQPPSPPTPVVEPPEPPAARVWVVATFGPTTAWVGKTITRDGDAFILEDHGPITAAGVMEYDRQGHLVWETAGTRAWVGSLGGPTALPFTRSGVVSEPAKAAPIATFTPGTAWAGKAITFESDQFVLEGHGPISSATVLQYEGQGHLLWPYPEMREWVVSQAAAPKRYKLSRVEWVLVGFGILALFGRLVAALG